MSADEVDEEKRHGQQRLELLGDLHGEVTVFEDMVVREIGPGGAQIEARVPLQLNSLHTVRLTLGDRSVVIKSRVVHCHISDVDQDAVVYRAGLEFVEMPAPVAEAIADFLQLLRAARTGAQ